MTSRDGEISREEPKYWFYVTGSFSFFHIKAMHILPSKCSKSEINRGQYQSDEQNSLFFLKTVSDVGLWSKLYLKYKSLVPGSFNGLCISFMWLKKSQKKQPGSIPLFRISSCILILLFHIKYILHRWAILMIWWV